MDDSPWGPKELDTTERLTLSLWCHVQEITKSNVIEEAVPLCSFLRVFFFFSKKLIQTFLFAQCGKYQNHRTEENQLYFM